MNQTDPVLDSMIHQHQFSENNYFNVSQIKIFKIWNMVHEFYELDLWRVCILFEAWHPQFFRMVREFFKNVYIYCRVILVWNSVMTHSIRKSISCEDRPGPPVGVMAEGLMDMLSKTINIVWGEFSWELKVLISKNQRPNCRVKPDRAREEEMV